MSEVVSIAEVVNLLPFQEDNSGYYFDRSHGKFLLIKEEDFFDAEHETPKSEIPQDRQETTWVASRILDGSQRFIGLPSRSEIDEYSIMDDYTNSLNLPDAQEVLREALSGRDVFTDFNEAIGRLSLDENWYDYKQAVFTEIAKQWCTEHQFEYTT